MKELSNKIESQLSGVYFLLSKGKCVYIGESKNILRRIREHTSSKKIIFDDFYYIKTEDRKGVEQSLIGIFNPKYNMVDVSSKKHKKCWVGKPYQFVVFESVHKRIKLISHVTHVQIRDIVEDLIMSFRIENTILIYKRSPYDNNIYSNRSNRCGRPTKKDDSRIFKCFISENACSRLKYIVKNCCFIDDENKEQKGSIKDFLNYIFIDYCSKHLETIFERI